MSKLKKLPDHSIEASGLKSKVDSNQCEKLKKQYGFKAEFNLYGYLLDAVLWYKSHKDIQAKRSVAEQITLLDELGERSNSLLECFDKLGFEERGKIIDRFGTHLDLEDIRYKLNALSMHSPIIAKELKGKVSKDSKENNPLKNFISRLAIIYELGTRCKPKCNYDDENSKYSGDYLEFSSEILNEINEVHSNSAIGQVIHEVLEIHKVKK